jgi:hypothetical protein
MAPTYTSMKGTPTRNEHSCHRKVASSNPVFQIQNETASQSRLQYDTHTRHRMGSKLHVAPTSHRALDWLTQLAAE